MTGTLVWLALSVAAFVGSHLLLSARPIRHALVALLGEMAFLGVYSSIALATFVWMIEAYAAAPYLELWSPPTALRHLSLTVMPFACILVVAGLTSPSPAAVSLDPQALAIRDPLGIQKITRHPVMWGFALWGVSHLLANGDAAAMLLFGGNTALALLGALHIDARKHLLLGHRWQRFASATSFVPFEAIIRGRTSVSVREIGWWRIGSGLVLYVLLLMAHPWLFGVYVWPL